MMLKVMLFVGTTIGIAAIQHHRLQQFLVPEQATVPEQAAIAARKDRSQLQILKTMPDFGFRNLVADWTFLNFLQYFGNAEHRDVMGYGLSADYFEIVLDRDPFSFLPYSYLSSSVSIFAGQPERAVELQEEGLQHLSPSFPPKGYFIWRNKGIDEILFLGDAEAASLSHEIAADWAAQSPYTAAQEDQYSLRRTAEFLASDPDRTQAQLNAWLQVLGSAPDDKTRAEAVEEIGLLGFEIIPNDQGQYTVRPKNSGAE